ncbi:hypothetical protein XENTR_v10001586 [Xenopus tropicalis]|uniref:Plasmalemma vesicle-associated protein n=2 Tax=Xenopus tropicalis TaxID=8364 RepID=A0A6I8QRG5_XENTR|nr:plasmalemma vesicle-associated protein [Xenopus tropicalis]KAE8632577.1 hypothetical protein XENTR_v10001586 [Xenopus tropicalis]|eukprot:XP_004911077.1 PREDICTED: plasmalemma vesicle-associated protein [Xenopus tropicalis]
MDSSYAMAKFGLESKDMLRSNQKSCWYYLKYFFLFTSLIQFLIILGLVLFMIYGNTNEGIEARVKTLESLNQKQMIEYKGLLMEYGKLNMKFNATAKEKDACRFELLDRKGKMENLTTINSLLNRLIKDKDRACEMNLSVVMKRFQGDIKTSEDDKKRLEIDLVACRAACRNSPDNPVCPPPSVQEKCIILPNRRLCSSYEIEKFTSTCLSIDEKFSVELQRLRSNFELAIARNVPSTIVTTYESRVQLDNILHSCRPLPAEVANYINTSLDNIKHKIVTNIELMSSKAETETALNRCLEDFRNVMSLQTTCTKEKDELRKDIERFRLTADSELNRSNKQLLAKMEELDKCKKQLEQQPRLFSHSG